MNNRLHVLGLKYFLLRGEWMGKKRNIFCLPGALQKGENTLCVRCMTSKYISGIQTYVKSTAKSKLAICSEVKCIIHSSLI